jgi:transcriptional regulator with XRE-family HTH domain
MKTLQEISVRLETERKRRGLKYVDLAAATGLSVLSVRQALHGQVAVRVPSLMALADQLGLELILVPKLVAQSLQAESKPAAKVLTDIERLLSQDTTLSLDSPKL